MKRLLILIFVALVVQTLPIQAHNGYRRKPMTHVGKRKKAYRVLRERVGSPLPVVHMPAEPIVQPEVMQEAVAHQTRIKISALPVKKALVATLLFVLSGQLVLSPRQTDPSFARGRIQRLWPAIADELRLPHNITINVGYHPSGSHSSGHFAYVHEDMIHIDDAACAGRDGSLAYVLAHEAVHIKYDMSEMGNMIIATCEKARMAGVPLPQMVSNSTSVMDEMTIITAFMKRLEDGSKWFISQREGAAEFFEDIGLHAAITSCAFARLHEFRADRLGCLVAKLPDCAGVMQSFFKKLGSNNTDSSFTHPADSRRVTAVAQLAKSKKVTIDALSHLDVTGKYSDTDLLPIVMHLAKLFDRYLESSSERQIILIVNSSFQSIEVAGVLLCGITGAGTLLCCSGRLFFCIGKKVYQLACKRR